VTGRYFAHNHLSKVKRAFLGTDVKAGKAQPVELTDKQIAALVGVSVPYLAAAEHVALEQPHLRPAIEGGFKPLLDAVPPPGRAERLATMWATASADERRAFVKMVGVDAMFDVAVAAA
jgi:hypothetical protein